MFIFPYKRTELNTHIQLVSDLFSSCLAPLWGSAQNFFFFFVILK